MEPRWEEVQSAVVVLALRHVNRWWTMSYLGSVLPGVSRSSLASGKAAGVMGRDMEPREGCSSDSIII